ncbi:MAG: PspA/IM30 family protein [Hyphomicrobiaceae bacterium]
MFKLLGTLMRGAATEAEEAVFEANAIRVLEQQLRDAAVALELSRRELACAMAHRASEARAVEALDERIRELERSCAAAIGGGREDLAGEAATAIAAAEDERAERRAAVGRFDKDITRLRQLSDDGRRRLADLRRGLEMARAQEALSRAGANGRRALATGTGALREAEATLSRIRRAHTRAEDEAAAAETLDAEASGKDLDDRLSEAGFGPRLKTSPSDVLARIRRGNPAAAPTTPPATEPQQ